MEKSLARIRAFLIDLDGTLYEDDTVIPGAVEAVAALRTRDYPLRFVTNTTSRCRQSLVRKLGRLGIPVEREEILSPTYAAARHLLDQEVGRAYLLVQEDARREFAGIEHADEDVAFVVVGDLEEEWTFERLNRGFQLVLEGAELIALGKSRYWRASDGFKLDAGPFVAALEFATGKEALVLGKPAAPFFHLAVNDLGLPPERVAMVGDSMDTDVGAAQQAGLAGILVRTGKFRPEDLNGSGEPDLIVDSVVDIAWGWKSGVSS